MTDKRDKYSHIRDDGMAKNSYSTWEEAAAVADEIWGRTNVPHAPYLCSQKPDHWHVGKGANDLVRR